MNGFEKAMARFQLALQKFGRSGRPTPCRKPPSAGPVAVESPRNPTLTGGAAAPLDID